MSQVNSIAIDKAIKLLNATHCQYAIVTSDGETYNNGLEIAVKKERQRALRKYPYGELTTYFSALINFNAEVGSVQVIPPGKYAPEVLRSGISSKLSREWGKDTYMTSISKEGVEILRLS